MRAKPNEYRLYGAEFSLYSGKVRAYLRRKGIVYTEINPSVSVYRKFIIPRTGVRFIPVLQTPDDQVIQESSEIIDFLEQQFPAHPVYPPGPKQRLAAQLLEVYGDEWLLIPAMHYRWNYKENHKFIHQEFGNMLFPWLPGCMRRWLGQKAGQRFAALVPKLGITGRTHAAIEQSWLDLQDELQAHFSAHDYLFGRQPSIGDFGLIAPLYAHLYRDPYPGRLMRKRAPAMAAWVERMLDPVAANGSFLAADEVPETLLPVLRRMAREQLPVLIDTDNRLAEWLQAHARAHTLGEEIPRTLGMHQFQLKDVREQRLLLPYALWKWQRVRRFWQSLDASAQHDCGALLRATGLAHAMRHDWQCNLQRRNNRYYADMPVDVPARCGDGPQQACS